MRMTISNRQGVSQDVPYGASSATIANPFGQQTYYISICSNSACRFRISEASAPMAAVATDTYLPANMERTLAVTPGQVISAIQSATNGLVTATAGTLSVTEVS